MRDLINIISEIDNTAMSLDDEWLADNPVYSGDLSREKLKIAPPLDPRQPDLFPNSPRHDLAFKPIGEIGGITVAKPSHRGKPGILLLVLFDVTEPVGYVRGYLGEDGVLKIRGVRIGEEWSGRGLAVALYRFILEKRLATIIEADIDQTPAGSAIWRKLIREKGLEVYSEDSADDTVERVTTMRDFNRVYSHDLMMWVKLAEV